jgi:uncharacterized protein (TIGR02145 family)
MKMMRIILKFSCILPVVLVMALLIVIVSGCKKEKDDDNGHISGTVKDIDGNTYTTIQIGTQVWMAENLKTTTFNDGAPIPHADADSLWSSAYVNQTPAYCWLQYDKATYGSVYGALYNAFAVVGGKLCPAGWRVPSDPDWQVLEMHLGMSQTVAESSGYRGTDEGGKLKEKGLDHWDDPNTGATNSSGFTALPGASRTGGSNDANPGLKGTWWTSTFYGSHNMYLREIKHSESRIGRYYLLKSYGFSVRCLKE